jgi:hypothetical protein
LPDKFPKRAFTPSLSDQSPSNRAPRYSIPGKRASQYTADDWGRVIDSTWGPGQSAVDQLNVFDSRPTMGWFSESLYQLGLLAHCLQTTDRLRPQPRAVLRADDADVACAPGDAYVCH